MSDNVKGSLRLNAVISGGYQVSMAIVGFFLPKLILMQYGSDVYGLLSSITRMLAIISFLDMGIWMVAQAALYKPLTELNYEEVSQIYIEVRSYFRNVAKVLLCYVLILCIYYGIFKSEEYSWIYTSALVIVVAISSFSEFYFGICNAILLETDQKAYIVSGVRLITGIANAIFMIVMIQVGFSIHFVKLISSIVYIIRPLYLNYYVQKEYNITFDSHLSEGKLKNQWSGVAQHVTASLRGTIDYFILTIWSQFKIISIYSIYLLPLAFINSLIETIAHRAYFPFFGKILAQKQGVLLNLEFEKYEKWLHIIVCCVFGCAYIVIVPFVMLYTKGTTDVNYENYSFAHWITLAYAILSLFTPYNALISVAGHFKQTQCYCWIECIIKSLVSVAGYYYYGLEGVAIGTATALLWRLLISVNYLKHNIIYAPLTRFARHITSDVIAFLIIIRIGNMMTVSTDSYMSWIIDASQIFAVSIIVVLLVHIMISSFFTRGRLISFEKND